MAEPVASRSVAITLRGRREHVQALPRRFELALRPIEPALPLLQPVPCRLEMLRDLGFETLCDLVCYPSFEGLCF